MISKDRIMSGFSKFNEHYFIFYVLIGVGVIFSFASPNFLTFPNMMTILRQASISAVIASGQFFVLTGGDFDLSVGSNVTLSGVFFAGAMVYFGYNPIVAMLIALCVGLSIGLINGLMVTEIGLPAFIATMATMVSCQGCALMLTKATPISKLPASIGWIGRGTLGDIRVFGVPYLVLIMLFIYIFVYIVTERTNFGRYIFAMGGNREAAYLSGINTRIYKIGTYLISGGISALASIMLVSRLAVADPYAGSGYEFESITACVIGGTAITGGKGNIFAVLFGALFLAALFNGMTLLNVNTYIQQILKGVVLAIAVGIDVMKNKKK